MGHGAEPVDVGALQCSGVRVIIDLVLDALAIVAVLLAIGAGGWLMELRDWLRGLLR